MRTVLFSIFAVQVFGTGVCASASEYVLSDPGPSDSRAIAQSPLLLPANIQSTVQPRDQQNTLPEDGPPPYYSSASRTHRGGTTLLITGGVFAGLGVAFLAVGTGIAFAPCTSRDGSGGCGSAGLGGLAFMAFGGLHLIIGIPMLAVGGYRYSHSN